MPGTPTIPPPAENKRNDALAALAKASPRGAYPRAFIGEQPYWTLAGSDGGKVGALIDEDAAIEPAKGSYSIAPVLIDAGKRFDWANVAAQQYLVDRQLPVPGRALDDPDRHARNQAARRSRRTRGLCRLHADQPHARAPLGRAPARRATVAGQPARPVPVAAGRGEPDRADRRRRPGVLSIVQPQEEGDPPVVRTLRYEGRPRIEPVALPASTGSDMAGADLVYPLDLAPGETRRIVVAMNDGAAVPPPFARAEAETLAHWRDVLGRVTLTVPPPSRRSPTPSPRPSARSSPAATGRCSSPARAATTAPGSATGR